jgi:hypothetical protein
LLVADVMPEPPNSDPWIERPLRLAVNVSGRVLERTGISRAAEDLLVAAISRILSGPELERIVAAVLESPGIGRVTDQVLESEGAERLVARVIESRLMDEAVARLLVSDDLWLMVDEIARSPAVTEAIGHQSIGFAEQVAGVVRDRSRNADTRLEQFARRLVRGHLKPNGTQPELEP